MHETTRGGGLEPDEGFIDDGMLAAFGHEIDVAADVGGAEPGRNEDHHRGENGQKSFHCNQLRESRSLAQGSVQPARRLKSEKVSNFVLRFRTENVSSKHARNGEKRRAVQ